MGPTAACVTRPEDHLRWPADAAGNARRARQIRNSAKSPARFRFAPDLREPAGRSERSARRLIVETAFVVRRKKSPSPNELPRDEAENPKNGRGQHDGLEEYNECEQRFTFPDRERDDLLHRSPTPARPSRELDYYQGTVRNRVAAINTNFTTAFHHDFRRRHSGKRLTEVDAR